MSSLPDEVVMQILARLPIKPLFKTKTVCKPWLSLASDKYFVSLYNELSGKNPMVMVEILDSILQKSSFIWVDNLRGVSEFSLDFLQDSFKIRASCNGLLCCSSNSVEGVYYVCNPITRDFKVVPKCKEWPVTQFYPHGEAVLVGLACDSSRNNKFKVALAGSHYTPESDWTFVCLTFDSSSNKWRKIVSSEVENFTHMNKNQVVFVNGALHWLNGSCAHVLVLDLEYENWRKIPLPKEACGRRAHLLESNGCLSLVMISDAWMRIWVMKDYESHVWHMVDKVFLRGMMGSVHGTFPIAQDGECVFFASHKQVIVYNRKSGVWKEMYSVKNGAKFPLWFSSYAFRTTILPCL